MDDARRPLPTAHHPDSRDRSENDRRQRPTGGKESCGLGAHGVPSGDARSRGVYLSANKYHAKFNTFLSEVVMVFVLA